MSTEGNQQTRRTPGVDSSPKQKKVKRSHFKDELNEFLDQLQSSEGRQQELWDALETLENRNVLELLKGVVRNCNLGVFDTATTKTIDDSGGSSSGGDTNDTVAATIDDSSGSSSSSSSGDTNTNPPLPPDDSEKLTLEGILGAMAKMIDKTKLSSLEIDAIFDPWERVSVKDLCFDPAWSKKTCEAITILNKAEIKGKTCSLRDLGDEEAVRRMLYDVKAITLTLEGVLGAIAEMIDKTKVSSLRITVHFTSDEVFSVKDLYFDPAWSDKTCEAITILNKAEIKGKTCSLRDLGDEEAVRKMLYDVKAITVADARFVKDALQKSNDNFLSSGLENYIQYTHGLVKTEPESPNLEIATNDCSRAVVTVVAGESGSGKSRFSVGALGGANGAACLRYSLKASDRSNERETNETRQNLRNLIELVTLELFDRKLQETSIYKDVRSVANRLNLRRNAWAFELAKEKVQVAIENVGSKHVSRWYDRKAKTDEDKLDKLVVIFDECGSSPDFVAGIIATARDYFLPFLRETKQLAKEVGLVLVGSGMEAVKIGKSGYLGSDPALTRVIIMKTTELSKLKDEELREAIQGGVIARILAQNARMLTQGLIPALTSDLVVKHVNDPSSKLHRRISFGSLHFAMDFCVRKYASLNALRTATANKRAKLLACCFRFLMRSALRKLPQSCACPLFEALKRGEKGDGTREEEEQVFHVGLATRDPTYTSGALKYLACSGATEHVCSTDGYTFKMVVAAHLERYYSAVHGYQVENIELKHAWPPAVEKDNLLDEDDIAILLLEMVKKGRDDINAIVSYFQKILGEDKKEAALVLRQGVSNAQGADVMVFVLKATGTGGFKLELSLFQAKNWESPRHSLAMGRAALRIGIDAETNVPETNQSGFSYKAATTLGDKVVYKFLQETSALKCDFALTNRVIVFNYSHSERSPTDMNAFDKLADNEKPVLWSREMLEPTISALVVAPDSDESEENDPDSTSSPVPAS